MKPVAFILTAAIVAVLVSDASSSAVPSTPRWAVVPGDTLCGKIETGCDPREEWEDFAHNFNQHFSEENREYIDGESGIGGGYHGECLACKYLGQWTYPEVCHPSCPGSGEDEEVQAAYEALIAEVERGDVHRALVAGRNVPQYVMINDSRRSLQILGCDERIIANLPLGDLYLQAKETLDESSN